MTTEDNMVVKDDAPVDLRQLTDALRKLESEYPLSERQALVDRFTEITTGVADEEQDIDKLVITTYAKKVIPPLKVALKQLRERANLTQEEAAAKMDWSVSKLIRIEGDKVGISTNDLIGLLNLYRATESKRNELLGMLAKIRAKKKAEQKEKRSEGEEEQPDMQE